MVGHNLSKMGKACDVNMSDFVDAISSNNLVVSAIQQRKITTPCSKSKKYFAKLFNLIGWLNILPMTYFSKSSERQELLHCISTLDMALHSIVCMDDEYLQLVVGTRIQHARLAQDRQHCLPYQSTYAEWLTNSQYHGLSSELGKLYTSAGFVILSHYVKALRKKDLKAFLLKVNQVNPDALIFIVSAMTNAPSFGNSEIKRCKRFVEQLCATCINNLNSNFGADTLEYLKLFKECILFQKKYSSCGKFRI